MMTDQPLPIRPRRPRATVTPKAAAIDAPIQIRPRGVRVDPVVDTVDAWDRQQTERVEGHLRRLVGKRRGLMPFGPDGPICVRDQNIFTVYYGRPLTEDPALAKSAKSSERTILEFDYVGTDRKSGEVSAEVTVYYDDPRDLLATFRTNANISSVERRDRIAKQLADRSPAHDLASWRRMLDQASDWVVTFHRGGDPAILLRDAPEPAADETSLLPPITAGEGATILFGDGGTGKSYLALALAIQLQTGRSDLFPGVMPSDTRRVAILDWEWTAWVHKRRMRKLLGSVPDAEMPDLAYVSCQLPLRDERDRLRRIIRDLGIEFLVIDSVALAAGGEPEASDTAVSFMSTLRDLGLPALLIAHVTKVEAKTSADKPFGSTFWHNAARSTWYAKRGDDVLDDGFTVGLFHRKANDAALAPPIGVRMRFGDTATTLERIEVREVGNLESERSLKFRIRDVLIGGSMTVKEIADELDESIENVRRTLNRERPALFVQTDGHEDRVMRWGIAARRTTP